MEGIKSTIFLLPEEALIEVIFLGRLNTRFVHNIDTLAESDHVMDALAQEMVQCVWLIKPVNRVRPVSHEEYQ